MRKPGIYVKELLQLTFIIALFLYNPWKSKVSKFNTIMRWNQNIPSCYIPENIHIYRYLLSFQKAWHCRSLCKSQSWLFSWISLTIEHILFIVSVLGQLLFEIRCIQLGDNNAEREYIFHKTCPHIQRRTVKPV